MIPRSSHASVPKFCSMAWSRAFTGNQRISEGEKQTVKETTSASFGSMWFICDFRKPSLFQCSVSPCARIPSTASDVSCLWTLYSQRNMRRIVDPEINPDIAAPIGKRMRYVYNGYIMSMSLALKWKLECRRKFQIFLAARARQKSIQLECLTTRFLLFCFRRTLCTNPLIAYNAYKLWFWSIIDLTVFLEKGQGKGSA